MTVFSALQRSFNSSKYNLHEQIPSSHSALQIQKSDSIYEISLQSDLVSAVFPKILYDLLEKDFLPIVFPIGFDDNYDSYNINADDAACAIAEAVHAEKLAFLSDIEGVYKDKDDSSSLISELHIQEARKLIEDGFVGGGMIPKLNNCIEAIEHGVNRVHILDGRIPHSLLLEIFTNKGIGTAILREDGEKYYNEHE